MSNRTNSKLEKQLSECEGSRLASQCQGWETDWTQGSHSGTRMALRRHPRMAAVSFNYARRLCLDETLNFFQKFRAIRTEF